MQYVANVTTSVVFVAELERSVRFYSDVFGCETALEQAGGALLLTPGGFQIYLITKGHRAPHPSGAIGDQYLMWATDTAEALEHFEHALKSADSYTDTHTAGGVRFVEGRDPDGIRVTIAHPSPQQRPRSVLDSRLYS